MRRYDITKPDEGMKADIQRQIDNLNKPKGSLGALEDIAMQVCLVQQTLKPRLQRPCHLLFGGDHGIEREGVSVSPRDVTWQQMINFARGGGGVNMFCRQHGFHLYIIDVGVDYDLTMCPSIFNRKIARGTDDFLYRAAMTEEQFNRALLVGEEFVNKCHAEGCGIICLGEMGIANTSPSSVWMSLLGGVSLDACIGVGAGLNSEGLIHKRKILAEAVSRYLSEQPNNADPTMIMRYFGGFEMVSAVGAMLRSAELHLIIMVDGFIMSACALAASTLYPDIKSYMIFGHQGDESGHKRLLQLMNANPILNLRLRLGEGTGALCAFPVIDSAVRMMNEMNNFDDANITKYF